MDAELEPLTDALMRIMTGDDWGRLIDDASFYNVSPLVQIRNALLVRSRESPELAREGLLSALRTARTDAPELLAELVRLVTPLHHEPSAHRGGAVDNSVFGGMFHAPVIQAATVNGGQHTYYGQPPHSSLPPIASWPRLDAVDPIALGVRRARRLPGEAALPRYVERDCDAELGTRVIEAAQSGGLVLVTGAPLSGKTRTAWTALVTNLPGTMRVFAPPPGTDLRGLPALLRGRSAGGCVLWLDDLEGHLGENGLTPMVLAALGHLKVPVLATMNDEVYDARRFGTSARARVLSGVEPVELNRHWTKNELQRLRGLSGGEPRLTDADLWRGDRSVTEFFSVGPELWDEWRRARRPNAFPRGHLLVRAAIDLARCGTGDAPIPFDVLRKVCALYEDTSVSADAGTFEDGLTWAAAVRHGVTGLLMPGPETGTWRAFGSLVMDVEARHDTPPVPLGMWLSAVDAVRDIPFGPESVAETAHAVLAPVSQGNPDSLLVLGYMERVRKNSEAAERWFRKAADAGSTTAAGILGRALADQGKAAAAIPYLETAAMAGDTEAQNALGMVLVGRARFWLGLAADAGHPAAAEALPPLRAAIATPPDTVEE
ncbi:sel1 repeat family protein [Streptomyces sp. DvalAA-19]|uniref:tetratricopeptide repeat protein n=1 Tax=Streptomyces sp. DvalAA-19 TaxID=1839761 RepID=UPI00081B26BB|nr:sel1 repeat family protein [Streptomyces sp. DvalAA-19]SCE31592.1 hypothetical protein GA0115244_123020 [Streptomyces sp. DvalAA-19]